MVGQFIPHCHRDGSYSPLQCLASTGFCWCSTTDGKKIPNTEIRGQPSCKFELQTFKLTELMSFDFAYIREVVLINYFLPHAVLNRG